MSKRIAIVGANGKVGSEVSLILGQLGHQPVPIVRGAQGAAFLRYMGVPVRVGSVGDPDQAPHLLAGCDMVVHLAYMGGTGPSVRAAHDLLIRNCIEAAPAGAQFIFFSTMVAHQGFGPPGHRRDAYGREKLRNEKLVRKLAAAARRETSILRLGHVCGEYQPITEMVRDLIRRGPLVLPDPDRHANCVATATVVDAILGLQARRIAPGGTFDLVNEPRWSWRKLLEWEAAQIGAPLALERAPEPPPRKISPASLLQPLARKAFNSRLLKRDADQLLNLLPKSWETRIKIRYAQQRNAAEVAQLGGPAAAGLDAATYPGWNTRVPPGLAATEDLLARPAYRAPREPVGPSWPPAP